MTTNTDHDDVIARYLTVGGATVELVEIPDGIRATCHGCPPSQLATRIGYYDPSGTGSHMPGHAIRIATEWAQEHAGSCRAMPLPERTTR